MQLPELEKAERKYPQLKNQLVKVEDYLTSLCERNVGIDIVPIIVADKVSIDENLALIILMLFHEAGLITPSYQVYCKSLDGNIASYKTKEEIPSIVYCPYHDQWHTTEDYVIDPVFHFTKIYKGKCSKVTSNI